MEKALKKIGNVILDYSKYSGKDLYTDGSVEDILLDAAINGSEDELLKSGSEWAILYHFSDIRENAIEWVPFTKEDEVLEIGSGCGAVTGILSRKTSKVTCVELSEKRSLINANRHRDRDNIEIKIGNFQDIEPELDKYDYITMIGVLEYAKMYIQAENPYVELCKIAKRHLKENGKLIIAIENKVGLKYWNGACEDHTGQMYSGINDYIDNDNVRTFSSNELKSLLADAGFVDANFYCAIPDYKMPNIISAYEYDLKPATIRTYKKNYSQVRIYNFMEDIANDQLCNDKMYSYMANSYVVITGNSEQDILFTKYCNERKKKFQIATSIIQDVSDIRVIKKPLYKEGIEHITSLKEKEDMCRDLLPNVNCVKGSLIDEMYVSDYIEGDSLEDLLYEHRHNLDKYIRVMLELAERYITPENGKMHTFIMTDTFKEIFGDICCEGELCMPVTNIDAIFSNIKIDNSGAAWLYDFEWVFNFDIPYRFVIWRAYKEIYNKYMAYFKAKISRKEFLKRLGFTDDEIDRYQRMENNFGDYVCGKNRIEEYTTRYVKSSITQTARIC